MWKTFEEGTGSAVHLGTGKSNLANNELCEALFLCEQRFFLCLEVKL